MRLGGFGGPFNLTSPVASVPNDDTQDPDVDGEEKQARKE
jgi:hypothetical protein